jgi:nicotinate-nucleotide adenylyltransferase
VTPADVQPFKDSAEVTLARHRLEMARLAIDGDDRFDVCDVDIVRGAPTYTVDTLRDVAARYPGAELFFITGADALAGVDTWKDAEALPGLATFVGVTRPGYSLSPGIPGERFVEVPAMQVSSTDVRRRIADGRPIRYLVPPAVVDYLVENVLYVGGADA